MSILRRESVPAARVDGLVVTASKDDVLVYDTSRHHIHHLNKMSAVVWRLCDGRRSVPDLVDATRLQIQGVVSEESVRLALAKLEDANLLDGPLLPGMRGEGQTRRALLKRAAVAGAVALPAVVSITAPTAAQGGSCPTNGNGRPNGCPCNGNGNCTSGNCVNGTCQPGGGGDDDDDGGGGGGDDDNGGGGGGDDDD